MSYTDNSDFLSQECSLRNLKSDVLETIYALMEAASK